MSVAAFRSRYHNVDGVIMHAQHSTNASLNNSPAIVLLHGLVVSNHYMMPLAKQLATLYPVVMPEMPGFGKSAKHLPPLSVPDLAHYLEEWLRVVGLKNVVIVANSFGCEIAAEYAKNNPSALAGLVLVSPMKDQDMGSIQYLVRWAMSAPLEPISYQPIMMKDYVLSGARRAIKTFRYGMKHETEKALHKIQAPTLLVKGGLDTLVPRKTIDKMQAQLAHGASATIPRAAHVLNYSRPNKLAELITGFMRKQERITHEIYA
jgi:pimeloyl-ACP methyl ester carboxylesterase